MEQFIEKVYSNPNFPIILFSIIGILIVLFLITLFLAIKDSKKNEKKQEKEESINKEQVVETPVTVSPVEVTPTETGFEDIKVEAPDNNLFEDIKFEDEKDSAFAFPSENDVVLPTPEMLASDVVLPVKNDDVTRNDIELPTINHESVDNTVLPTIPNDVPVVKQASVEQDLPFPAFASEVKEEQKEVNVIDSTDPVKVVTETPIINVKSLNDIDAEEYKINN